MIDLLSCRVIAFLLRRPVWAYNCPATLMLSFRQDPRHPNWCLRRPGQLVATMLIARTPFKDGQERDQRASKLNSLLGLFSGGVK